MTDDDILDVLRPRLTDVRGRIAAACACAGRRDAVQIQIVAVTKTVGVRVVRLLPRLGLTFIGENRPQELARKAEALSDLGHQVHFEMIGHLQRNKVDLVLKHSGFIQSVDSVRLLRAIDSAAGKRGRRADVLLQVNASREPQKHGFAPEEMPNLEPEMEKLVNVRVLGLMTMAADAADPETARPTFAETRKLFERLRNDWFTVGIGVGIGFMHLSMGMSGDYEVAVEEGATVVRLGSVLFAGLPGPEEDGP